MENELTAKELLEFFDNTKSEEISKIFEGDDNFYEVLGNWRYAGIIDKIKRYKQHTEIDIRCVTTCRIIQVKPNDNKQCVYEEDIYNSGTAIDERIAVERILKEYASTHEGDFFAVKSNRYMAIRGDENDR